MKVRYNDNTSRLAMTEALFNEADSDFAGAGTQAGTDPFGDAATYATGTGMTTAGEAKKVTLRVTHLHQWHSLLKKQL